MISCKKPYTPPVIGAPNSYLVVEGVINSGADSTIFKLSRTVNLSAQTTANPEAGAALTIESNQHSSYPLTETKTGYYTSAGLNLDDKQLYRLRIQTSDNQQYLSDFVPVIVTPPIDSIGYNTSNKGMQLYVNTHDPKNNTHYYRWDYEETWRFHAQYYSLSRSNGTAIVPRTYDQRVYYCYAGHTSSTIVLGSSAKLREDVINQNPLLEIPSTSEKIELEYSILVRQYALTSDAFAFWQNLKLNTENLGSIFDAQPSTFAGNIHGTGKSSPSAKGYLSACKVQSKRIFIANSELPQTWQSVYPFSCSLDSNYYSAPGSGFNQVADNLISLPNSDIPTIPWTKNGIILGFLSSTSGCADCTVRGSLTQPAFWK